MQDIKSSVRGFLTATVIPPAGGVAFSDSDSFMERRLIDSAGFLALVRFLEQTYHIMVADEDMIAANLDSLDNIERYIHRRRSR